MEETNPTLLARREDPATSLRAARANRRGRVGQKWRLLIAHGQAFESNPDGYRGLTCDEAWELTGGAWPTASCYWQRHRELADIHGYLSRVRGADGEVIERQGLSGLDRQVYELTQPGWDKYLTFRGTSAGR